MYSVRNTAARDAASQLHLLQRHTSLRPRHFLHVTDDANGRPSQLSDHLKVTAQAP
jgi:hypothetical protein